ncbi:triose-phosphate transporter family-domain-containing protein [Coprinopsis sp. MPI-PUGE-AT-0042]|nr:triose-phosphate transporter family-domain-containing protein [Coprinopsis sp. MPI-PUGE-AT-0042]
MWKRWSGAFWLTMYFFLNLSLTLYNSFTERRVVALLLYSVLYSVNIVVSNASLRLVTVPVVRALTPLFTVLLSIILLGKYSSRAKIITLVPVVAGVGLATYGDYYFTPRGFFLTLLGTVLAALKTITTNLLQSRSSPIPKADLHPPLSPSLFKFPSSHIHGRYEHLSEKAETGFEYPRLQGSNSIPAPITSTPLNGPFLSLHNQPLMFESEPNEPQMAKPASPPFVSKVSPILLERSHTRLHSATPAFLTPEGATLQRLRKAMVDLVDLPRLTLSPLQLLYLLSPIAFIQCTLLAYYSGELQLVNIHLSRVTHEYMKRSLDSDPLVVATTFGRLKGLASLGGSPRLWLLLNGILAFFLNVVSFNANRKVGALAMSVSANVKQVLAVLCSVTLFNLQVTAMNGLGIFLTIVGGAWYAAVELEEKKCRKIETT